MDGVAFIAELSYNHSTIKKNGSTVEWHGCQCHRATAYIMSIDSLLSGLYKTACLFMDTSYVSC
ncbi:hypothetical protein Leryth_002466 [Lithospermum erythrorhizon]|nr:hypothetical protein Leryth_002466 [Lithospermum erythrorhizon]